MRLGSGRAVRDEERRELRDAVDRAQRVLTRLGYLDAFGLAVAFGRDAGIVCGRAAADDRGQDGASAAGAGGSESNDPVMGGPGAVPERWSRLISVVRREAPKVSAVLVASPPALMTHGLYRTLPQPVTHAEAELVRSTLEMWGTGGGSLAEASGIAAIAGSLARGKVILVPGVGIVVGAGNLDDAMFRLHSLEHAAVASLAVTRIAGASSSVGPTDREIRAIEADRMSGESVQRPARRSFFDHYDPPTRRRVPVPALADDDARGLVAGACRILSLVPGLVEYKEHVSLRTPDGSAFVMSPALMFGDMVPDAIVSIAFDDDASWEASAAAPTRFRFYHRDLLRSDPRRHAVVHTHGWGVNSLLLAGREVLPAHRLWTRTGPTPTVRPSMLFRAGDRSDALRRWGSSEILHVSAHGTDYFMDDIRRSTVAAMHHEMAARLILDGAHLGSPRELSTEMAHWLDDHDPTPRVWWDSYAARVDWTGWRVGDEIST